MLPETKEVKHKYSSHKHGNGNGETISGSHVFGGAEIKYYQYATEAQNPVDARNINLSADIGWILNRYLGPEVQQYCLTDKRIRTADKSLAGNNGCCRSNKYAWN